MQTFKSENHDPKEVLTEQEVKLEKLSKLVWVFPLYCL